jgi:ectoine hydroxylase-related dioxygenase (phytanoyl-CoA dioxygenase family)
MNRSPLREITDDEIRRYDADGIVCLRGMFDADWLARLAELVEEDLAAPGPLTMELERSAAAGRFFFDTFMWTRMEGFREFVFCSPAAEIAARISGSSRVNIFFDQLLIKESGTEEPTPWHNDLPYWPLDGARISTVWLALDEVTRDSGAVEYVKGSHRWAAGYHPPAFAGDDRYKTDLPKLPDIEAMRDALDIARFDLAPGDCTVHHALTVHGAPGNARADRRRRAVVTRWAGDGVVYRPRPNIQPMAWDPDIAPGGPIDSDLWPVVWTAACAPAAPGSRGRAGSA